MFRDVIRVLLAHLQDFDANTQGVSFDKLAIVDKLMMVRLLEFSRLITEIYDRFDLKEVFLQTQSFMI